MNRQIQKGIFLAVLAAALYAISTPFSKLFLNDIPPTIMAGLLYLGERASSIGPVLTALTVGFFAYGIGIYVYVYAQRFIGAVRTSAYYAIAPFISAALSMVILREMPNILYLTALFLMAVGTWLCSSDEPLYGAE